MQVTNLTEWRISLAGQYVLIIYCYDEGTVFSPCSRLLCAIEVCFVQLDPVGQNSLQVKSRCIRPFRCYFTAGKLWLVTLWLIVVGYLGMKHVKIYNHLPMGTRNLTSGSLWESLFCNLLGQGGLHCYNISPPLLKSEVSFIKSLFSATGFSFIKTE